MSQNNEAMLPKLEDPGIKSIEDLLTPEEAASLYADLNEMAKQRVLNAGAVALYFFA